MTVAAVGREHATFVDEVREQLSGEAVQRELSQLLESDEREPDARPLYRELGRLGLLAVNWPEEYGGQGRTLLESALVVEELVRAGVPDTLHVNTVQIVGLFLLLAGTPEQKERYLPAFARGEKFASVLYTEPGSGSDLASLRATAVADGDDYRLNGTKVFSLKSHITDVGLAAVRTSDEGSKYAGITLFLVDLDAEGVRGSVIPSIADEQFHRIELHDVRVPGDAVVGAVGEGWPLLSKALAIERTGLDYLLKAERWLAAAVEGLGDAEPDGAIVADVGRYGGAIEASRALTWSVLEQLSDDVVDEPRAAAAKYYSSELAQEIALWAPLVHGSGYGAGRLPAASARVLESAFREAPGLTLSAGTSEMMLQIVAGSALDDEGDTANGGDPDDVHAELRAALRNAFAAAPKGTDPHAPPVSHGADSPAWPVLLKFGAPKFELPASAGGLDLGLESAAIALEELGRAGLGSPYAGVALMAYALRVGDADGADDLLQELAGGETVPILAGFGGPTERPVAAADGDVFCVPAEVDGATVLRVVQREQLAGEPERLPDGEVLLHLDEARVGESDVVAPLDDDGEVMAAARIRQAAYLAGIAGGAHAEAVRHATKRKQFDEPLRTFQSVAFRLADAQVRLEALRSLVYSAARPAASEDASMRAREALALAAETALAVVRTSTQVCGARGMTAETSLHRFYRLARLEATRFGTPRALWAASGLARLGA
jgi:alkylation response protein AidB-like acyl-CoA dehydrogenase